MTGNDVLKLFRDEVARLNKLKYYELAGYNARVAYRKQKGMRGYTLVTQNRRGING